MSTANCGLLHFDVSGPYLWTAGETIEVTAVLNDTVWCVYVMFMVSYDWGT
jgi:hypothetical protein